MTSSGITIIYVHKIPGVNYYFKQVFLKKNLNLLPLNHLELGLVMCQQFSSRIACFHSISRINNMSLDHVDCTLLANNVCKDAVSECQEQMMNLTREYSVSSITVSIIMLNSIDFDCTGMII